MQFESLFLAMVMGTNHHVAVRGHFHTGWLSFDPADPDLRSADWSSSSAGVVFLQVTYEGLPASTYTYHHMTLIQHPYIQNFIPNTVAAFRLFLNKELDGTAARGVFDNVPHNIIHNVIGACAPPACGSA